MNNGTELGGLVLSTTGYWSIKEVSFDGVTVKATKCINFGMLASTLFGRDYDSYGFDYFKGDGYMASVAEATFAAGWSQYL